MKTTTFGNNGQQVSLVGLGGEGVLRTHNQWQEADDVIREAIDRGITYFDSARVYADSELYYGKVWGKDPKLRRTIFQTSKSASRDKQGARNDLERSLERLQTDYLDLWQIHDVRTKEDFQAIAGPGGALEAFVEARDKGRVRRIGVTGHHDPRILTQAVKEWPVDAVLMPVNPVEEIIGGFLTDTLQAARAKGLAIIGMKVLGAGHYVLPEMDITAEMLLRFVLSYDITLPIIGCSSIAEVQSLGDTVRKAKPLNESERKKILAIFTPYARRMAFYRDPALQS